jgi:exodeoxyribonuclease VII small subunit
VRPVTLDFFTASEPLHSGRFWYKPPAMAARRPNEFEKAFQQLEKIVQRLEGEELPLDDSLQLFEEGIRLSRFCHQRLEEVEKKIELILADAKGQPVVEPFEDEEVHEDEEIAE